MTFRVFWSPHAEEQLESLLKGAADITSLAEAARQLDRQLAADPHGFGESRYDTMRIGFVRPLGIQFDVMGDVQTVIVYDVWRIDRK